MTSLEKLSSVRNMMANTALDAIILPSADPHMDEYLPEYWKIIPWLTGFTGSAGTVVITKDFAGVWTDSRYFIQADNQLKNSGFSLVKLIVPHTPEFIDWLASHLAPGSKIGYNGQTVSLALARSIRAMAEAHQLSVLENVDLITPLWSDRPPLPNTPYTIHQTTYTGLSVREKAERIRKQMKRQHADLLLLVAPDEVSWLLNIRSTDIPFNPVVLAYAMVFMQEIRLFAEVKQLSPEVLAYLENEGVTIYPYEVWWEHLTLQEDGTRIWVSPTTTDVRTYRTIESRCVVVESPTPVSLEKAVKNETEIRHIRESMISDGIALERFFFWLEHQPDITTITEVSAAKKLESFRGQQPNYQGASFPTISSFGAHGAIVHYIPSEVTDVPLTPDGIFLLDSGGHYLNGTTDVTRTMVIGTPDNQQKEDFTRVLKGMISLARLNFPEGTKGIQMDILARHALWQAGINYGHGTGHGVGYFLNVHESPPSISAGVSPSAATPVVPGMVISDEPGIYRENEYGIRLENLILCVPVGETPFGRFFGFETLTLCHIEAQMIIPEMLSLEERTWLNQYHGRVFQLISPHLSGEETAWLAEKTKPLEVK